jgi:ATP-dependent Clp protease, protease subunit
VHHTTTPETPAAASGGLADRLTSGLMFRRVVLVGQEIDDDLASRVCSQLLLLSAEDPDADVVLLISSPGGSVSAGLAMYDVMRLIPNDVSTVALGTAASMGQFLLSAGTPGKRFALPHARVLMHQGSAGLQGTAVDIAIQAENLEHTKKVMLTLIAEHTGQPYDRVERDSDRDRWFTADEALAYGFVDAVATDLAQVLPARDRRPAGLAGAR